MTMHWTAEVDADIAAKLSNGVSLTKIADALGVHRRTLTQRVDRLGLSRPTAGADEWSDVQTAELARLWDAKLSSRAIAAALGVSKNAVIGRAHRLGLEPRQKIIATERKPRGPRKPRRLHTPHKRDVLGKLVAPKAFVPRVVVAEPLNISFADLAENSCRYPYGEIAPFTFCGHPQDKPSSYCEAHRLLCEPGMATRLPRAEYERIKRENFRAYKAELVEA
jgi:GcrA cell cycle regulator